MKQALCRQVDNCGAFSASFCWNAFPRIPRSYGTSSGEQFAVIASSFCRILESLLQKTSLQVTSSPTGSCFSTSNCRAGENTCRTSTYVLRHSPLTSSPRPSEDSFSKNYRSITLHCG